MSRIQALLTLLGFTALAALTAAADLADDKPAPKPEAPANDKAFHETLTSIAKHYKSAGYVDYDARWAPGLCRAPVPGKDYIPAQARISTSKDDDTHGRKLYFLFARDRAAYVKIGLEERTKSEKVGDPLKGYRYSPDDFGRVIIPKVKALQPLQQFIVKESWAPEEVAERDTGKLWGRDSIDFVPKDGKFYKPGKQGDLYVMFKIDPKTPGTDAGWVYGTLTPDAQTVTSSGKVDSCMSCHTKAKHDRQFGLTSVRPEGQDWSKPTEEKASGK